MEEFTWIPLKYLDLFVTLEKTSVWKIFINILWWDEELNDIETIYFNLIMTDIKEINKEFQPDTFFYKFKISNKNELFFKIWISKDIKKRMWQIRGWWYNVQCLYEKKFKTKEFALAYEKSELEKHRDNWLQYIPKIEFAWMTECFISLLN